MEPTDRKLLDRVRDALRLKHYSIRTEEAYVNWIKRYIYFHNVRHPAEMGEVQSFLTHLAVKEDVAASTQNQALSALLFLYRQVLNQDLGPIDALRAKNRNACPPSWPETRPTGTLTPPRTSTARGRRPSSSSGRPTRSGHVGRSSGSFHGSLRGDGAGEL
jgi:hypothetical protein